MEQNLEIMGLELEQMREQLTILNRKLDHEAIINEKMVREIMKNKIVIVDRMGRQRLLMTILGFFCLLFVFIRIEVPWWFYCIVAIVNIIEAVAAYYSCQIIKVSDMTQCTLVEINQKICDLRKFYSNYAKIETPLGILYTVGLIIGIMYFAGYEKEMWVVFILGGILGGTIAYFADRKIKCAIRNISQHIDDLTYKED